MTPSSASRSKGQGSFGPPIEESIGDLVATLKERAEIIVLLTHQGSWADRQLAQAFPEIDIIFGGHSHELFRSLVVAEGTDTMVQHSGAHGSTFVELTVTWDRDQMIEPELQVVPVSHAVPPLSPSRRYARSSCPKRSSPIEDPCCRRR
jgi:2',3'-cyclic-nucleotide 2'-phosphodiesterase (5'-nucleotidase family)